MTREFDSLSREHKNLIKQHIKERIALAAQEAAPAAPMAGPAAAGMAGPVGGEMPQGAEMVEEQADTEQIPPLVNA